MHTTKETINLASLLSDKYVICDNESVIVLETKIFNIKDFCYATNVCVYSAMLYEYVAMNSDLTHVSYDDVRKSIELARTKYSKTHSGGFDTKILLERISNVAASSKTNALQELFKLTNNEATSILVFLENEKRLDFFNLKDCLIPQSTVSETFLRTLTVISQIELRFNMTYKE